MKILNYRKLLTPAYQLPAKQDARPKGNNSKKIDFLWKSKTTERHHFEVRKEHLPTGTPKLNTSVQ